MYSGGVLRQGVYAFIFAIKSSFARQLKALDKYINIASKYFLLSNSFFQFSADLIGT